MKIHARFISAMLLAAVCLTPVWAQDAEEEDVTLEKGDEAPGFALPEWSEEELEQAREEDLELPEKLSDFKGEKNLLVAFYPRVFTGGCTAQLCGYRDEFELFVSADTDVIAISMDEQEESDRFREEYELPFYVVGDEEGAIVDAYGVPRRGEEGNEFASRSVFLVDKQGVIRYIDLEYGVEEGLAPLYEAMDEVMKEQEETEQARLETSGN
ncbi:MAG: peroxiredoxin [Candidatus Hydrogenedentota bacterium]